MSGRRQSDKAKCMQKSTKSKDIFQQESEEEILVCKTKRKRSRTISSSDSEEETEVSKTPQTTNNIQKKNAKKSVCEPEERWTEAAKKKEIDVIPLGHKRLHNSPKHRPWADAKIAIDGSPKKYTKVLNLRPDYKSVEMEQQKRKQSVPVGIARPIHRTEDKRRADMSNRLVEAARFSGKIGKLLKGIGKGSNSEKFNLKNRKGDIASYKIPKVKLKPLLPSPKMQCSPEIIKPKKIFPSPVYQGQGSLVDNIIMDSMKTCPWKASEDIKPKTEPLPTGWSLSKSTHSIKADFHNPGKLLAEVAPRSECSMRRLSQESSSSSCTDAKSPIQAKPRISPGYMITTAICKKSMNRRPSFESQSSDSSMASTPQRETDVVEHVSRKNLNSDSLKPAKPSVPKSTIGKCRTNIQAYKGNIQTHKNEFAASATCSKLMKNISCSPDIKSSVLLKEEKKYVTQLNMPQVFKTGSHPKLSKPGMQNRARPDLKHQVSCSNTSASHSTSMIKKRSISLDAYKQRHSVQTDSSHNMSMEQIPEPEVSVSNYDRSEKKTKPSVLKHDGAKDRQTHVSKHEERQEKKHVTPHGHAKSVSYKEHSEQHRGFKHDKTKHGYSGHKEKKTPEHTRSSMEQTKFNKRKHDEQNYVSSSASSAERPQKAGLPAKYSSEQEQHYRKQQPQQASAGWDTGTISILPQVLALLQQRTEAGLGQATAQSSQSAGAPQPGQQIVCASHEQVEKLKQLKDALEALKKIQQYAMK